ncbi:MAG: N-acetyltransferase family protein [Methylophilaceae bacterium]
MSNFKIDEARLEDIPALVGLLAELFSIEADFKPDTTKQVKGLQLLLQAPDRSVIKVARDSKNAVVGMVSAQLVISTAQGAPSAWIEDMVVSSSFRSGGVGRALLQAAQNWSMEKGATRMQLLVDTENQPALDYYQHLGWESTQLQARRLFF